MKVYVYLEHLFCDLVRQLNQQQIKIQEKNEQVYWNQDKAPVLVLTWILNQTKCFKKQVSQAPIKTESLYFLKCTGTNLEGDNIWTD